MIGDDQIIALRLQAGVGHVDKIFPAMSRGIEFGEPCRLDALIRSKLEGAPLGKQRQDGLVDPVNNSMPLDRVTIRTFRRQSKTQSPKKARLECRRTTYIASGHAEPRSKIRCAVPSQRPAFAARRAPDQSSGTRTRRRYSLNQIKAALTLLSQHDRSSV